MEYSRNWITWRAMIQPTTCPECYTRNGRIYSFDDLGKIGKPQLHPNCRCWLERMAAVRAGNATDLGTNGADWWLKYLHELPDYYITKEDARQLGWSDVLGNLAEVASDCMLFGGIFENRRHQLPEKDGRIWYEADINYVRGYRNKQRVVFSNDGLIFVTYDHYRTFAEIIGEE